MNPSKLFAMPFLLLVPMSVMASDLSKSSAIGRTIEDLRKTYNKVEQIRCEREISQSCREKLKSVCDCYQTTVSLSGEQSQTMYFYASGGMVVDFLDQRRSAPLLYDTFMGHVEAFAGDEKPDQVSVMGRPANGYQSFALNWKRGDVNYRVNAICPLTVSAGKSEVKTPLKKCHPGTIAGSKIRDFSQEGMTKVDLAY